MIIKKKEIQASDVQCNCSPFTDQPDPSSQTQIRPPFQVAPPGL